MTGRRLERTADAVLEGVGRLAARVQTARGLSADVLESDAAFLVVFDAPDARISDVDVRFDRGTVRVSIDRFREHREGFETRIPGRGLRLEGQARLPEDAAVDPEEARAEVHDDGTLHVYVPKVEAA